MKERSEAGSHSREGKKSLRLDIIKALLEIEVKT
jgi:hypothetical protein